VANDGLAKIWYLNAIGLLFGWRHLLDGHSPFANSWQHRAADSFPYNLVTAEIRRKRAPDIHITNSAKLQLNKLWLEPKHLLRTLGASHFIFRHKGLTRTIIFHDVGFTGLQFLNAQKRRVLSGRK
jgi:hypothetical protein